MLSHEIWLTNTEITNIIKLIKPLGNRGISLKTATKKTINLKRRFCSNVLEPLMRVGLPLMNNVFTPSGKSILIPLG